MRDIREAEKERQEMRKSEAALAIRRKEEWDRQLKRDREEVENEKLRTSEEFRGYRDELKENYRIEIDDPQFIHMMHMKIDEEAERTKERLKDTIERNKSRIAGVKSSIKETMRKIDDKEETDRIEKKIEEFDRRTAEVRRDHEANRAALERGREGKVPQDREELMGLSQR